MTMSPKIIKDDALNMYLASFENVHELFSIHLDLNIPTSPFESINNNIIISPIQWKIKKPNIQFLKDMTDLACEAYLKYKSEVQVFLMYNTKSKKYYLHIPKQIVASASCDYEMEDFPKEEVIVCNFHSHHTMTCGFSGTDDNDDRNKSIIPTIAIVIKKINSFNLLNIDNNYDIRLGFWGKLYNLEIDDVFDSNPRWVDSIDWESRVSERPAPVYAPKNRNYGGVPFSLDNYSIKSKEQTIEDNEDDYLDLFKSKKDDNF